MTVSRKLLFILAAAAIAPTATAQVGVEQRPDLNQDGKITKQEVLEVADNRFRASDLNHDGVLSLDEVEKSALQRFEAQDANKDGVVTRKELRSAFMARR